MDMVYKDHAIKIYPTAGKFNSTQSCDPEHTHKRKLTWKTLIVFLNNDKDLLRG